MIICPYTKVRISGVSDYDEDEEVTCPKCHLCIRSAAEVESDCPYNEDTLDGSEDWE